MHLLQAPAADHEWWMWRMCHQQKQEVSVYYTFVGMRRCPSTAVVAVKRKT